MKQSPIPAISRRSLRGVEQQEQEEDDEERGRKEGKKEGKKEGAVEKMKRLLRVDSDETDDLHDKYRYRISTGAKVEYKYRISTGTKVEFKYRISTSTKIFETHPALFCE